jgi:hypothetical protein
MEDFFDGSKVANLSHQTKNNHLKENQSESL